MSLVLGPLFTHPLHPAPWCSYGALRGTPGCPRLDYRVTNSYTGRDLVNGGQHKATDVGNASMGADVLMPARKPVRALHHFDGALGVEVDLGGGWSLEAWHLGSLALPIPSRPATGTAKSPWVTLERGVRLGTTGNTGGKLANGNPMPAHTHIELIRDSALVDAEPYLFGKPLEGAPDDMPTFIDVPADHRFATAIEWVAEQGISKGIANTDPPEFRPDDPVTRGQMAAFLHRFAKALDLE